MSDGASPPDGSRAADPDGFGFEDGSWESRLAGARKAPCEGALGDFRLVEVIGRGGQGAVFKAVQPGTDRTVAIKRVALGASRRGPAYERFRREVELAASLHHAGIVTIHELIDDNSAVVMEWIDGVDAHVWGDRVRAQEGGVRRIVSAIRRAAEAAAYAHARGVLHRDLKPSNILIDAADQPHIVDFGLARLVETDPSAGVRRERSETITMDGAFAGTPVYAPPEQIDLGLHETDVRGDVYALGAVLYRLLSGRDPFEAPTLAGLFDLIRRGDPPAPSASNPHVGDELDAIVTMAMRPRREERYQTMEALAEDLGRWLGRKAVRAVPTSTIYLARAFVRRHRVSVLLGAIALAVVVGSGIGAALFALELSRQRAALLRTVSERDGALADSVTQRQRVQSELVKSIAVNMGVMRVLDDVAGANAEHRRALLEGFQRRAEALDASKVPMRAEIEIGNRIQLASIFRTFGDDERARVQLDRALAIGRARAAGSSDLSHALGDAAVLALEQRRFAESCALFEESHANKLSAFGAVEGSVAQERLRYAEALVGAGRKQDAQRVIDELHEPRTAQEIRESASTLVVQTCDKCGLTAPSWASHARSDPGNLPK